MYWNPEVLTRIDAADDLKIAPYHPDMNTTGTPTWIWEVKVDNRLFVRAYSGIRSKWYQAALSQQAGKILAIGQEFDVLFAKPSDPELESKIDQAYLKKYSGSSYDTIMITGRGQNPQEGMAVVDWLRLAAPHARRIVSICGGAMLLAQTGLLDGRRATTHWKLLETMQAEFPQIRVEGGPLYIQDEHIWTSGGVSSGFDLTLALVEEDYGFSLARDIAQDFVMYLRRPGGQLQFSRYNLQQTATQGPINDLLAWLLENLTADLSVDKLAEKVAMSPRNFTRVFTRETGASPARYVAEARLAAARQRLEQTHETLDRIAEQTGFGSSINLRRLFEKQLNLTPGEYRQRFHCRKMA